MFRPIVQANDSRQISCPNFEYKKSEINTILSADFWKRSIVCQKSGKTLIRAMKLLTIQAAGDFLQAPRQLMLLDKEKGFPSLH